MVFIGRKSEVKQLKLAKDSKRSEFLAIYGRRRVGKTCLVREFFKDSPNYIEFTGQYKVPMKTQIQNFNKVLEEKLFKQSLLVSPRTWAESFAILKQALLEKKTKEKVVLFFDELPWMDTPRSQFLSHLEYFWNTFAEKQRNILLIVCGSAASWMIKKIVNSKGGLHNRITKSPIRLEPFSLKEVKQFFESRQVKLQNRSIVDLYMVLGGVPFYLENYSKKLSVVQNINQLCFSQNGLLLDEYNRLFDSLFDDSKMHKKIVEELAKVKKGLQRSNLIQVLKFKGAPPGSFQRALKNLEESGFIDVKSAFRKAERDNIYRLCDEYTLFYLKWIKPVQTRVKKGQIKDYWKNQYLTQSYKTWAGYAFEGVCLKHVLNIIKALGISGIQALPSQWNGRKAQIDLLLDRADNTITICEMKYYKGEFKLTSSYKKEFLVKLQNFQEETRHKSDIHIVFITSEGCLKNDHFNDLVNENLTLDVFF